MHALIHLGDMAPTRNANASPHDYAGEYARLKRWAEEQREPFEQRAQGYVVPRILRREAITMVKWWTDASRGYTAYTSKEDHPTVHNAFSLMVMAAYGTVEAATGRTKLTEAQLSEELPYSDAEAFWRGMRIMATSLGAAKTVPTLFDRGVLLLKTLGESAIDLPGRIADTAKDVKSSVDTAVTALKWAGVVGGGLLTIYVLTRVIPARPARHRELTS